MSLKDTKQLTFGWSFLQGCLDPEHKLIKLAEQIDWDEIEEKLEPYYSNLGRGGLPIRLMVGLHLLKHLENLSDAQCSDRIRSDLYWMYFCGVDTESLRGRFAHLNSSSMTKFRARIGAQGMSEVGQVVQDYLIDQNKINPKVMSTDSACMEKNIEYPTDSKLLDRGRKQLLKGMKELEHLGITMVQGVRSGSRKSQKLLVEMMKLGKDRAERIEKGTLELASMLVHVWNKCHQMVVRSERALKRGSQSIQNQIKLKATIMYLKAQMEILDKVIYQARERFKGHHVPNKVYSLHEPDVIAIRKGKRPKPNEYGSKFNLSIDSNGYIVSHELYHENISDVHLLNPAIQNWTAQTGKRPKQVNADRGYGQKVKTEGEHRQVPKLCIPSKGKMKHEQENKRWFKKGKSMRAGIEAVIGHLKQDHRLDKSRYKGKKGDHINLILGSLAWNLNKLSKETG